ncbi:MAG TPA: hypothetical protein VEX38_02510 [Fimbriimonadaceae bacterium]|nr:hypothetical protein [Fimbriimonadaceae bacterium]
MEAGQVFLNICLIAFASFWLAAYTYGLYSLGRRLAQRPSLRLKPRHVLACVLLTAGLLSWATVGIDMAIAFKIAAVVGIFILHAQPTCVGFWAGCEIGRKADQELFRERADEWLREWETRLPH